MKIGSDGVRRCCGFGFVGVGLQLLGPQRQEYGLVNDASYKVMTNFVQGQYFGSYFKGAPIGYGLGLMNFSNMTWGFQDPSFGLLYGHNG